MLTKIRELYWQVVGWPDVPPRNFPYKSSKISPYTGKPLKMRCFSIASDYSNGLSLEFIATMNNITRERVRQCLWKAYRESK